MLTYRTAFKFEDVVLCRGNSAQWMIRLILKGWTDPLEGGGRLASTWLPGSEESIGSRLFLLTWVLTPTRSSTYRTLLGSLPLSVLKIGKFPQNMKREWRNSWERHRQQHYRKRSDDTWWEQVKEGTKWWPSETASGQILDGNEGMRKIFWANRMADSTMLHSLLPLSRTIIPHIGLMRNFTAQSLQIACQSCNSIPEGSILP